MQTTSLANIFHSLFSGELLYRQMFVGRYRNFESFTSLHFFILLGVGIGAGYLCSMLLKIISDHYDNQIAAIPKLKLPFQEDMTRDIFKSTLGESLRVQEMAHNRRLLPSDNSKIVAELLGEDYAEIIRCGDENWYTLKSNITLHFPTVVRRSPAILERHAVQRRPGLLLKDFKTVRAYVAALEKAFPSLTHELCMAYVEMYESVVYGEASIRLSQYLTFVNTVLEVVSKINNKALLHVKSSGVRSSAQREAQRTRAEGLA